MAKTLLITGATGKQGGAVIDALLDLDKQGTQFTILAVTRDASSAAATRLLAKAPHGNLRLVQGNLNDVPALFEAARQASPDPSRDSPVWGVYSVQLSAAQGATSETEVAQGTALIDGAVEAGVKHFVYSSVERGGDEASWENPTDILHFLTKHRIERHLREATAPGKPGAGMGWVVLRPVAFMDNLAPGFMSKVFVAALRNYLGDRDKPLQWVATADIGVFAAKAFIEPEKWKGRAVGLAGDELTVEQLSEAFVKATGRPAPMTYWFFGSLFTLVVKEMRLMLAWSASHGYRADIDARRKEHPGLLTMEEWLKTKSGFAAKK
ncbi:hypothetical protein VTK56DRAFT_5783 [Thermocarpiscus australiensis]